MKSCQADSSKHLKEYKALCQKLSATMEDLNRDNVNKEQFGKVISLIGRYRYRPVAGDGAR